MTDFNALIPELTDWNGGKGIDIDSWIGCVGNFQQAIGYSHIFWPGFVEHDDMVFREAFNIDAMNGFMDQRNGNKTSVEAVMNHLHIADLQHMGCQDISRERLVYLGHVLTEIHKVKLAHDFPDRSFEMLFDDSDRDDLLDYQMTFFQKR